MDHKQSREKSDCQHHVHERSGKRDDQALPARLCKEGAWVGRLLTRLFAGHLHVPAEEDKREPEVRLALLEAKKPRAEAEAERFDLYIEETRRPIVPQFMDQDHHPDQNQQPPDVLNDMHTNYLRSH